MKDIEITTLVKKTLKEVKKYGYCDSSYKKYNYYYKNLLKYYEKKGIKNYSYNISIQFLKDICDININSNDLSNWQITKRRAIKMLDDVYNNREFKIEYNYNPVILTTNNIELLNKYIEYNKKNGLSPKNIYGIEKLIIRFLKYIEINKITIENINLDAINKFLFQLTNINKITLKNYIFTLKMFLLYLYDNNIINKNIGYLLPNIKRINNAKLPSIWNFDDLNKLLSSIDTSTKEGKRNLAIIMIAITTTLRASDIINLKMENIDFNKNIITVIQQKNKKEIILPLMEKTKIALIDYIENSRLKNSDYQNVFLSCKNITKPITTSSLSGILKKYSNRLNLTNNQKRGIHSLRHTTLNYLFNDNKTSLTTITEISGHSNPNSLNSYIKTDINRLSEFTLNTKDFMRDTDEQIKL